LTTEQDLAINNMNTQIRNMANQYFVLARAVSKFVVGIGLLSSVVPAFALTPVERCNQLRRYVFSGGPPSIGSPMYRCGISKGADCSEMDKGPLSSEWVNLKCWNYDPPGYYRSGGQGANSSTSRVTVAKGNYPDVSCEFGGRVGTVYFTNNASYPVSVKLWHPDSISIHAAKTASAGSTVTFDFNVGDDWGIQLGTSKIKCIGNASRWDGRSFVVDTNNFY
jgi:hypothetical protein